MAKRPKTGGRVAGTPNKATREIKEIARVYGPKAIKLLWGLAEGADSDAARVSAIRELLDRGYGKPAQTIEMPEGGPVLGLIMVPMKSGD